MSRAPCWVQLVSRAGFGPQFGVQAALGGSGCALGVSLLHHVGDRRSAEALFQLVELGPRQEPVSKQRAHLLNPEGVGPCSVLPGRFGTRSRLKV